MRREAARIALGRKKNEMKHPRKCCMVGILLAAVKGTLCCFGEDTQHRDFNIYDINEAMQQTQKYLFFT